MAKKRREVIVENGEGKEGKEGMTRKAYLAGFDIQRCHFNGLASHIFGGGHFSTYYGPGGRLWMSGCGSVKDRGGIASRKLEGGRLKRRRRREGSDERGEDDSGLHFDGGW
jgi:hypothetical protein